MIEDFFANGENHHGNVVGFRCDSQTFVLTLPRHVEKGALSRVSITTRSASLLIIGLLAHFRVSVTWLHHMNWTPPTCVLWAIMIHKTMMSASTYDPRSSRFQSLSNEPRQFALHGSAAPNLRMEYNSNCSPGHMWNELLVEIPFQRRLKDTAMENYGWFIYNIFWVDAFGTKHLYQHFTSKTRMSGLSMPIPKATVATMTGHCFPTIFAIPSALRKQTWLRKCFVKIVESDLASLLDKLAIYVRTTQMQHAYPYIH